MSIETRCRGCGKILRIDQRYAGNRARCTHCRTEFDVPSQSDDAALDSVCHYCGASLPIGEQADVEFKTCQPCRESIDENLRDLEEEGRRVDMQTKYFVLLFGLALAGAAILSSLGSLFR